MAPPKQIKLLLAQFPKEPWAKSLVEAINQMSLETTAALASSEAKFKTLKFKTGAVVADSFPIDFPVPAPLSSMRVAKVEKGPSSTGAVTVQWAMLTGGRQVQVQMITGLSVSSSYEIRLALE